MTVTPQDIWLLVAAFGFYSLTKFAARCVLDGRAEAACIAVSRSDPVRSAAS